jgi:hypothetical protein
MRLIRPSLMAMSALDRVSPTAIDDRPARYDEIVFHSLALLETSILLLSHMLRKCRLARAASSWPWVLTNQANRIHPKSGSTKKGGEHG